MPMPDFAVPYAAPAQPKIIAPAMPPWQRVSVFEVQTNESLSRRTIATKGANFGVK